MHLSAMSPCIVERDKENHIDLVSTTPATVQRSKYVLADAMHDVGGSIARLGCDSTAPASLCTNGKSAPHAAPCTPSSLVFCKVPCQNIILGTPALFGACLLARPFSRRDTSEGDVLSFVEAKTLAAGL